MNDVPALFFEGVVSQFFFKEALLAGCSLTGLPGHVASEAYAKRCRHIMWLRNGRLAEEIYFNCENQRVDTEKLSRRNLHYTGIAISAKKKEYSTDPEATHRILNVTKGKHVFLSLHTSNFSKEIAKMHRLNPTYLWVEIAHEDHKRRSEDDPITSGEEHFERDVNRRDVDIEDETAQLLVDLLKQKQFHEMVLHAKCSAALKEIIASCRENSSEMVGKMIHCKEEFSELQLSLTEFPFEECTEEDKREAKLAYTFAGRWPRITTKLVLKNQDGSAVYCFSRPAPLLKSVFLFA